ncbi:tripartite tricarboxylate transporter substrate binding protein [Verticiella sediminum]|uniref:Tripartite tricarboxylate transporter substrate binding protein n=1 Tax=Verticiella sediminum TaxID=1247510 RepID=A0A556AQ91_9BURK|nr:tripartite tricarboxylate transporter substrate binding protein [Verticiella sediminum]TSH95053.1 tripartite tricarboxylate transporter substrate binding protein [Verticiella sediminum]
MPFSLTLLRNAARGCTRRVAASLLLGGALVCAMPAALQAAQPSPANWPERPITFIVPFPPGGNSDNLGRIMAEQLRIKLGVPVIVENRPGGTTSVGTEALARAQPDGYTLLLGAATAFTVLPHLRKLPYDPERDFTFAAGIADYLPIVTASPQLGVRSLQELVELARQRPGELKIGSAGIASAGHIASEIIKRASGIDVLHVPYKGSAELISALQGGQIDFFIDGVGLNMAQDGRGVALATFAERRHPMLPDVPSLPEAGIKEDLPQGGWGLVLPAGTDPAIVAKVGAAAKTILADPDTIDRLLRASVVAEYIDPAPYRENLAKAYRFYGELIPAVGIATQ